jgi:hypothetical protein
MDRDILRYGTVDGGYAPSLTLEAEWPLPAPFRPLND